MVPGRRAGNTDPAPNPVQMVRVRREPPKPPNGHTRPEILSCIHNKGKTGLKVGS